MKIFLENVLLATVVIVSWFATLMSYGTDCEIIACLFSIVLTGYYILKGANE